MKKIILIAGVLGIFAGSTAITSAGYFNTSPISRCNISITSQLQTGSENEDVYTLQSLLSRAGYLNANPNGYFGPATKSAVKRFQRDNGISATGYVGEMTINAINERLCDTDVNGDALSYNNYGYGSGVTYVDAYDAYARVISPTITTPTVYTNPQSSINNSSYVNVNDTYNTSVYSTPSTSAYPTYNPSAPNTYPVLTPATTQNQIQSTNIIYSPSTGYTYGIVPQPGSLTISTPLANTVYNEGDTVYLAWSTKNLNVSGFNILLENNITGQSKIVASTQGNNASFVLTKQVLDSVCFGVCDNNQQGSFRVVVTTPVTDIAGTTSALRAAISPITIKRPIAFPSVSISGSKNPVNSNEVFKLYVNIPTVPVLNTNTYGQYSFKIHAICPASVQVSIAGVPCGQDFDMPVPTTNFQQEIPAVITNGTYYRRDVTFELNVVNNVNSQLIGTAQTTITVNATPFNF